MKIRNFIKITHRDIGYLCVGLTIIYAVSGIAVNHLNDWNPNYDIEKHSYQLEANQDSSLTVEELTSYIMSQLALTDSLRNIFKPAPDKLQLFFENKNVTVNLSTWKAEMEVINSRTGFRETNFLHLNVPKKAWTYVADLYAGSLIFLAITGMFMIQGKKGIKGRGKWLVAFGLLIPLAFLLIYY
jgi:hypothetical protein